MPKIAFVFPGQGSQYVGMGKELADSFEEAAEVFASADRISGYKLSSICFDGPQELLDQTVNAQPAILVCSLACLAVARKHGLTSGLMAGLSLGEYTALTAAGAITLEEVLSLVMKRAELMQKAVPLGTGAMAAVIGMNNEVVEQICSQVKGIVRIANYNCPGQLVISGEKAAVEEASGLLKQAGAKTKILAISVPSHSPLMQDCANQFAEEINKVTFQEPVFGVVSNVNAEENLALDIPN
jgi:[acyl-carrier-protein] S-malonyltransferase